MTGDPYELKNQYANPERAELKDRLHAELETLKRETGYRVPPNADPDRFGKEDPATPKRAKAKVL